MEQNVDTKSASRPLAAIPPFNPESQLFRRGIFSLFQRRQIFNWSTKFVADGKFWKYIGFHLFPLRRLLVDNCVEQRSVNYKKIFGGFNSGWIILHLFVISVNFWGPVYAFGYCKENIKQNVFMHLRSNSTTYFHQASYNIISRI